MTLGYIQSKTPPPKHTKSLYLNRGEAPPELFPFSFSKALLVAKQLGGLIPREWEGREGRGGGKEKEKKGLGLPGHPGGGLSSPHPHLPLVGLRVLGRGCSETKRQKGGP